MTMIKTNIKLILESQIGLEPLMRAKLPIKAKYSVSKLAKACQAKLEEYNKDREELFKAAGCTIEGDKYTHVDPAVVEKCVKESAEMQLVECEINALPLDLALFGDAEIEGPAFVGMDWAIKE